MVESPFSYGFPMVFPWFSHGFPMIFPFSHGFPMVFLASLRRQTRESDCVEIAECILGFDDPTVLKESGWERWSYTVAPVKYSEVIVNTP